MAYPYYVGPQASQQAPAQAAYGYPQQPQGQLEQLRAAQAYQAAQQAAQAQQAGAGIQWVQGEAGAKAFWVSPGVSVLLMDSEEPKFYIKSADGAGMPLPLRIFDYTERHAQQAPVTAAPTQAQPANYATREELAALIQRIEDIEHRDAPVPVPQAEPEKTEKGGQQHGKRSVPAAQ